MQETMKLLKRLYDTEIVEIEKEVSHHDKCITTNDFNKFWGAEFDVRSKQAKLGTPND